MAQLLIAAAVGVILTLVISRISLHTVQVGKRANDRSVLHQMQAEATALNKDITALLKAWRDPSMSPITGEIADCIPETAAPKCLAAENIADPTVQQKAAGFTVRSVRLSNVFKKGTQLGVPIAGTEQDPFFYDGEGAPCLAGGRNPQCRFQGIAYMIRQNAGGDPGNVRFIVKFERNPRTKTPEETPLVPAYAVIEVGLRWRSPSAPSACSGIMGFDAAGDPVCYAYPNCQDGKHFSGWDGAGVPQCVGDLQPDCPPNHGVAGFDAQGVRVCKPVVNAAQWSGCTVPCNGGVATTCTYPFPNPAIPNDGGCSKPPPACNTGPCTCSHTGADCWTPWSACTAGTCQKVGQNTRRCQAVAPKTCTDPTNAYPIKTIKVPEIVGGKKIGFKDVLAQDKPCDFAAVNKWTGQNRPFPIVWAPSPAACGFDHWYDTSGCAYAAGGVPTWPWPGSPPGSPSFSADQCKYGSFPRSSLHIFGPGVFITGGSVPNSP